MNKKIAAQEIKTIDSLYKYQIDRVFATMDLIEQKWDYTNYKILINRLVESNAEARRLDNLRHHLIFP